MCALDRSSYPALCGVPQVTECVVELPGLSMGGGWPAMGLKDNAVPRVTLMTLKCWAITGHMERTVIVSESSQVLPALV